MGALLQDGRGKQGKRKTRGEVKSWSAVGGAVSPDLRGIPVLYRQAAGRTHVSLACPHFSGGQGSGLVTLLTPHCSVRSLLRTSTQPNGTLNLNSSHTIEPTYKSRISVHVNCKLKLCIKANSCAPNANKQRAVVVVVAVCLASRGRAACIMPALARILAATAAALLLPRRSPTTSRTR